MAKKDKKKIIIPAAVIACILACGIVYTVSQTASDKITKNIEIEGINVGELTKKQAVDKITKSGKLNHATLVYDDRRWIIKDSDIDMKTNLEKTVDTAYEYNRKGNPLKNIFSTLALDFGKKENIPVDLTYNSEKLKYKIESIKRNLDKKTENATLVYQNGKVTIKPSHPGLEVNLDKTYNNMKNALDKDKMTAEMSMKVEPAKVTEESFKGIDTLLSEYSTVFYGMPGRDFNIKKSAYDSSGIILKPGEEFSFNKATGEKTVKNGYRMAPVIESGKLVMGCGGGVCQTSSTIFNAALFAGMEITDRRSHTIPSDYVKMGRDATVFDGDPGQDFKFRNPFKNNIYIKNYVDGNRVICQIFGSKKDYKEIKITTATLSTYGGGEKVITDPSLAPGKRIVEGYSRPGIKMVTYRSYLDKDGKEIKKEKIGYSNYPPQTRIVRVGAGTVRPNTGINSGIQNGVVGIGQQGANAQTGTNAQTGANRYPGSTAPQQQINRGNINSGIRNNTAGTRKYNSNTNVNQRYNRNNVNNNNHN